MIENKSVSEIIELVFDPVPSHCSALIIHSSLIDFYFPIEGVNALRDGLVLTAEKRGLSLIIPTFTFGLSSNWTPYTVTSHCGALGKSFVAEFSTFRSIHPTHSSITLGTVAKGVVQKDAFDKNSPFTKALRDEGFMNIGLGLDLDGAGTFLHAIEREIEVPYREVVNLQVGCDLGDECLTNFTYYARKRGVEINSWRELERTLVEVGLFTKMCSASKISFCNPSAVARFVLPKLKNDGLYFYRDGEYQ